MLLITWGEEFSINVPEMNEQHKGSINIINELDNSLMSSLSSEALEKVFSDVIDYTVYHFYEEEKLLEEINCPGFYDHKAYSHTLYA